MGVFVAWVVPPSLATATDGAVIQIIARMEKTFKRNRAVFIVGIHSPFPESHPERTRCPGSHDYRRSCHPYVLIFPSCLLLSRMNLTSCLSKSCLTINPHYKLWLTSCHLLSLCCRQIFHGNISVIVAI